MLARNLSQTLVKFASDFYRSRADRWLVARDNVALAQHPPAGNHDVADELGAHREKEMAGEIVGRKRRCGAVDREHQIGGGPWFKNAELYAQALRGKPRGLAEHFERLAERDRQGGIVAFEFSDTSFSPHVGADPVGAQQRWPFQFGNGHVSNAVVHVG